MQRLRCFKSFWQLLKPNCERAHVQASCSRYYAHGPRNFGLLFDIDGVLVRGGTPIPAAKQCFRNLVDRTGQCRVPVVFVTNAGNSMRHTKAEHLSHVLEVEVSPDQVVMCHSPLRMFTQFHKKRVLVSGQGPVVEIAHNLGFEDVVTIDMLREAYPALDVVDQSRRPKTLMPPSEGFRTIDAIILLGDPIRWETNLQLIIDLLLTNGNPGQTWSSRLHPHIPVLACNMDLLWMAEAQNPRFGHGSFLVCLENLYKKLTGKELKYEALIGKPSVVTYNYSELLIRQQAERLGWTTPVKRLYAIGDNPMSDVYGANLYNRHLQTSTCTKAKKTNSCREEDDSDITGEIPPAGVCGSEQDLPEGCSSILVCTGVYSRDQQGAYSDTGQTASEQEAFQGHRDFHFDPVLLQPSFTVHDVKEAVELVFLREGWTLE